MFCFLFSLFALFSALHYFFSASFCFPEDFPDECCIVTVCLLLDFFRFIFFFLVYFRFFGLFLFFWLISLLMSLFIFFVSYLISFITSSFLLQIFPRSFYSQGLCKIPQAIPTLPPCCRYSFIFLCNVVRVGRAEMTSCVTMPSLHPSRSFCACPGA